MGDTTFELYCIGGMHSASDIAVFVPEHGLLMTGDTMADNWLTDTPGCLASFMARPGVRHDFPLLLENWSRLLAKKDADQDARPRPLERRALLRGLRGQGRLRRDALGRRQQGGRRRAGDLRRPPAEYRLNTRFPELATSPGFSRTQHDTTILEMWTP